MTDRPILLPDLCFAWLQERDEWVEIGQVCVGIGNASHESVRKALDKLTADGRAIKRIPRHKPGLRVMYRAFAEADPLARLEQHWPAPIKRKH